MRLYEVQFRHLNKQDNTMVISSFSKEEVKGTIWECVGSKCLGPDWFNFHFIKKCWGMIKDDIMKVMHDFYSREVPPKGITAFFYPLSLKMTTLSPLESTNLYLLWEAYTKSLPKLC